MASDVGHLLCETFVSDPAGFAECFSATYYDAADGKRHFSLRSPEGGADCGAVAKRIAEQLNVEHNQYLDRTYGPSRRKIKFVGGGHHHAAGFDAPLGWNGE